MKRFKVGIAGFGVQGTTVAALMVEKRIVTPDDLVIIDRNKQPLEMFEARLGDCRTELLRSAHSDHVAPRRQDFSEWARRCGLPTHDLARQWSRPPVNQFLAHARDVAQRYDLANRVHRGLIARVTRADDGIHIATSGNNLRVDRLILAMGMDAPEMPEWATRYQGHEQRIAHVFDRDYELGHLPSGRQAAVVGGGITAVQVARSLVVTKNQRVLLLTRKPLDDDGTEQIPRTKSEDWYDIERRKHLCRMEYGERLAYLATQGDRGTIPPWDRLWLDEAIVRGQVEHRVASVAHLDPNPDAIEIILDDDTGTVIPVELVVLATGLRRRMHDWLVSSANRMKLPFFRDEPVLDDTLQWGKDSGIRILGPHAGTVLGPYAGNICGGRVGATICCDALARELRL